MTSDYTTRRRPVRITLDATATRPPGRGRTWSAEFGDWRAEGVSEKAAGDALAGHLREFLVQYRPPTVLTFRGCVAVVTVDIGSAYAPITWHQQIVRRGGRVSSSSGSAASWEEAEAHARHNLAHISTDWHDDTSVQEAAAYLEGGDRFEYGQYGPDELYGYAAWQRAAKAAMDAGRHGWHQWASDHQAEFAVARPDASAPGAAGKGPARSA
ncbi:hypothetical protein [Polymorphospora sp. NPDC050346]|uniref:hypothetical protein n=1 Tax=Polymorphospora sp. NPDC050346 TaxID=3155780 RepID=UPI0033D4BC91